MTGNNSLPYRRLNLRECISYRLNITINIIFEKLNKIRFEPSVESRVRIIAVMPYCRIAVKGLCQLRKSYNRYPLLPYCPALLPYCRIALAPPEIRNPQVLWKARGEVSTENVSRTIVLGILPLPRIVVKRRDGSHL